MSTHHHRNPSPAAASPGVLLGAAVQPGKRAATSREAVAMLYQLTKQDTGASAGAASVLLSAAYPDDYLLSLVDLSRLDRAHYHAAMVVLDMRVRFGSSPANTLDQGPQRLRLLAKDWGHKFHHNKGALQ